MVSCPTDSLSLFVEGALRGGGGEGPTYIHGSISVSGAAHVARPGAKQALCLIKAQHCISGTRLLEQSVYVLGGVPHPLGNQASTVHYLHINTRTPPKHEPFSFQVRGTTPQA